MRHLWIFLPQSKIFIRTIPTRGSPMIQTPECPGSFGINIRSDRRSELRKKKKKKSIGIGTPRRLYPRPENIFIENCFSTVSYFFVTSYLTLLAFYFRILFIFIIVRTTYILYPIQPTPQPNKCNVDFSSKRKKRNSQ